MEERDFVKEGQFHSVMLLQGDCEGCTHCVRRCPTEAIRVRDGYARIDSDRCIDCGECIRVCKNGAKFGYSDPLQMIQRFKYKIAIPASAFAGQFKSTVPLNKLLSGLISLGFDEVYEVALGAEIATLAIREYLENPDRVMPAISSACPATVRLIQVRFPSLVDHIITVETPMDIAAKVVKESRHKKLGIPMEDIGVFFISPCPAKVTAVKQPVAAARNFVDGAIAIKDVYNRIMAILEDIEDIPGIARASGLGISWGTAGGENEHIGVGKRIAADGITNVVRILEKIEDGELDDFDFVELQACVGGCVGGVLTAEEPFIARQRVETYKTRKDEMGINNGCPNGFTYEELLEKLANGEFDLKELVEPRPIFKLGSDMAETIRLLDEIKLIQDDLPGLDCGACGCPTCRALAEDITLGESSVFDCIFKMRERLLGLTGEMMELSAAILPPEQIKILEKTTPDMEDNS